jgi:regulator of RNase E activity RraA
MNEQLEKEYEEYEKKGRIWGNVPKEKIKKIKFPRIGRNIITQFLEMDDLTSTVSDVLDSLGINGAIPASYLSPIMPEQKMVGTAVTMRSIPERKTPTQGYIDKDFIRMATRDLYHLAEPGDVAVADYGGNLDVSNMGGQSCTVAKSCGLVGAVVYGAIRDVATIRELKYPVWCRGITPITGKFRIEAIEINAPVTLHNVTVVPGDLIIADDSGVCVVPADKVEFVLEKVKSILGEEAQMRELINKKAPISELKPLYRKRYK